MTPSLIMTKLFAIATPIRLWPSRPSSMVVLMRIESGRPASLLISGGKIIGALYYAQYRKSGTG